MALIVDTSIAASWCFADESTPYTEQILEQVRRDGAIAPALWPFELASAIAMGLRRGRLTPIETREALATIQGLQLTVDGVDPLALLPTLVWLANETGLTAYDASYLELAQRRVLPLATLDARLRAAAQQRGLAVL